MTPPETMPESKVAQAAERAETRLMKTFSYIGIVFTLFVMPLLGLVYANVRGNQTAQEQEIKALAARMEAHELAQAQALGGQRLERIETALQEIRADVKEMKARGGR